MPQQEDLYERLCSYENLECAYKKALDNPELLTSTMQCPNGCKDGACINETKPQPIACTDSDGGKNYNQQGSVIKIDLSGTSTNLGTDFCTEAGQLMEYQCCTVDSPCPYTGFVEGSGSHVYNCPNGCKDGACLNVAGELTCPPDKEVIVQMDKCKESGLDYIKKVNGNGCIVVTCAEKTKEKPEEVPKKAAECGGCLLDDKCLPIGTRANKQYCDIDNKMKDIKADSASCSNNFECTSNLCVNDACVAGNVWQKFLSWISGLFGG